MDYVLHLTHAEAAGLSAATLYADGQHRHPSVQSAREKLRKALDGPCNARWAAKATIGPHGLTAADWHEVDDGERYVALEC